MQVVMTRVKLKPNSYEACAELFRDTNPDLVQREKDWLGAQLLYHPASGIVTVLATWRDAKSYEVMRGTLRFQHTMRKFSEFFAEPPEITVNDVLVDMSVENVG